MLLKILFYLFAILGAINIVHLGLYLIGANVYDIKAYLQRLKWSRKPRRNPPLVSVLIPAYNEDKVIRRCLDSVWANTYENVEIIVINDGSQDRTSEVVQKFIDEKRAESSITRMKLIETESGVKRIWYRVHEQPRRWSVTLVEQTNGGKARALNNGLTSYAHGRLIMMLDADSMLQKKAIENAVRHLDDPNIVGVAANVRIIENPTVLGVLQRFEHMVGYRSKKFYSVINSELLVGGVASTYRRSILEKVGFYDTDTATEDIGLSMKIASSGNKAKKLVYAADVVAMTEGVSTFKALLTQRYRWKLGSLQNIFKHRALIFARDDKYTRSLTWYRAPMSIIGELMLMLEPIALAYIVYASMRFMTLGLFVGAYMTITLYMLFIIWPDEHLTAKGKLKATCYAPTLYFVFYLMNTIQLIAAVRCIWNNKKITDLSQSESTWISPERAGGAALIS